MGQSLDQILLEVGEGDRVGVTVATNQDNGIVGYATGHLLYYPATVIAKAQTGGPFLRPARLSTTGGKPLMFYFSDRMLDIDPPSAGPFVNSPRQPFSANATDELGFSLSMGIGPRVIKLTFISWENVTFGVPVESRGNLLIGLGPSLGVSDHAVYVVSFTGIFRESPVRTK